jgi:PIN domain nuclease of toxin-antitoxin system
MIYVLDSSAMIAFLRNESGATTVAAMLADPHSQCYAHALNLCEVFYDFFRVGGELAAQSAITELLNLEVHERRDLGAAFWQEAGRLKAVHRRVSLADCCALTLTLRVSGELVTSDHHELDALAAAGVCPINFFR